MPFQQFAPFFKPEELDTLTAAFNATLQELRASGIDLSSEDKIALVKRKLGQRILVSATAGGVRDVETLKEQALRSLSAALAPVVSKPLLRKQLAPYGGRITPRQLNSAKGQSGFPPGSIGGSLKHHPEQDL